MKTQIIQENKKSFFIKLILKLINQLMHNVGDFSKVVLKGLASRTHLKNCLEINWYYSSSIILLAYRSRLELD